MLALDRQHRIEPQPQDILLRDLSFAIRVVVMQLLRNGEHDSNSKGELAISVNGSKVTPEGLLSTMGRYLARAIRSAMLSDLALQHWQLLTDNIRARGSHEKPNAAQSVLPRCNRRLCFAFCRGFDSTQHETPCAWAEFGLKAQGCLDLSLRFLKVPEMPEAARRLLRRGL